MKRKFEGPKSNLSQKEQTKITRHIFLEHAPQIKITPTKAGYGYFDFTHNDCKLKSDNVTYRFHFKNCNPLAKNKAQCKPHLVCLEKLEDKDKDCKLC